LASEEDDMKLLGEGQTFSGRLHPPAKPPGSSPPIHLSACLTITWLMRSV